MGDALAMVDVSIAPMQLLKNDILILASDGILTLTEKEIAIIISNNTNSSAERIARLITNAVELKKRPRQDNTSVQIVILPRSIGSTSSFDVHTAYWVIFIFAILLSIIFFAFRNDAYRTVNSFFSLIRNQVTDYSSNSVIEPQPKPIQINADSPRDKGSAADAVSGSPQTQKTEEKSNLAPRPDDHNDSNGNAADKKPNTKERDHIRGGKKSENQDKSSKGSSKSEVPRGASKKDANTSRQGNSQTALPEAPKSTAPAEAPKSTVPAEAPKSTAPAEAPKSTAPAEAPKSTAPAEAPKSTAPAEAPKSTAPAEVPKPTAPAEGEKTNRQKPTKDNESNAPFVPIPRDLKNNSDQPRLESR